MCAIDPIMEQENETSNDVVSLQRAEELYEQKRLLEAAKFLERVSSVGRENLFTDLHRMILRWANIVEKGMEDLLQNPEQDNNCSWIKQRETHGDRDFLVFYQLTNENQLIARID